MLKIFENILHKKHIESHLPGFSPLLHNYRGFAHIFDVFGNCSVESTKDQWKALHSIFCPNFWLAVYRYIIYISLVCNDSVWHGSVCNGLWKTHERNRTHERLFLCWRDAKRKYGWQFQLHYCVVHHLIFIFLYSVELHSDFRCSQK